MRRFVIFTAMIAAITMFAGCMHRMGGKIKGSGIYTTKNFTVSDYSEIEASKTVRVIVSDTLTGDAIVKADNNLIDFVIVTVKDGKIRLSIDKSINSLVHTFVEITVPNSGKIHSLTASSSASIIVDPVLSGNDVCVNVSSNGAVRAAVKSDGCFIYASSSGAVNMGLDVKQCVVDVSSASKVRLNGRAGACHVEASSSADVDAIGLIAGKCDLTASSASSVTITCQSSLEATATSAASIRYAGDCKGGIINMSSAGRVSHI